jgi:hypothetical protein
MSHGRGITVLKFCESRLCLFLIASLPTGNKYRRGDLVSVASPTSGSSPLFRYGFGLGDGFLQRGNIGFEGKRLPVVVPHDETGPLSSTVQGGGKRRSGFAKSCRASVVLAGRDRAGSRGARE